MIRLDSHIIHYTLSPFRKACLAMLLLISGMFSASSQVNSVSEYQVKAVFLYNFTHFIDWPPASFDDKYAPFIIGVLDNDPLAPFIEQAIKGEWIGTHILRLERFNSVEEIGKCHILYISSDDPDEVKKMLKIAVKKRILTVGDTPNFARWGGMIRFYKEAGKLRLQINNTVAKSEGLKISSKLLRVADVL